MRRILLCCLLLSCGNDDDGYPEGSLPSCESYCERLRTSNGGCAGEVEACPDECELWRRNNSDAACTRQFDDLLSCTSGTDEVCESIRNECDSTWRSWRDCLGVCDDVASVSDVTFSPECASDAPCASGTELTMSYPGPLPCTTMVKLTCAGEPTIGYLPASEGESTGTIELSCTGASGCGLYNETATYYSSGGATVVSCTP